MVLIFVAHIEGTLIHLYTKKKIKSKKKIFGPGKGGGPLKALPHSKTYLGLGTCKLLEIFRI